jgi:hypothetical protein
MQTLYMFWLTAENPPPGEGPTFSFSCFKIFLIPTLPRTGLCLTNLRLTSPKGP